MWSAKVAPVMLDVTLALLRCLLSGFQSHSRLAFEYLALRHQLTVFNRQARKPKLRPAVRLLWVALLPLTGDPVVLESTWVQTTLIAAKHLR
jgi:hypothetical protein